MATVFSKLIWTGVYADLDGVDPGDELQMLFTVAETKAMAVSAFEEFICMLTGEQEIDGPDRIASIELNEGETCDQVLGRLHNLGYKFVFPCRENVDDKLVPDVVKLLLKE